MRIPVQMRGKRSKYGVRNDAEGKAARTIDGILFASKAEAKRYFELKLLEKAGKIGPLERQYQYDLTVNGYKVGTYIADFVYIEYIDGADRLPHVEDVKGVRTPLYRLKKKLMKAIYGIDIIEIGVR